MARFPTFDNDISREGACTGGLSATHCRMSVHNLEIGMFVEELDKPWIESGFLLQGFFIETQDQIDQLQEECVFVFVNQASVADAIRRKRSTRHRFDVIQGGNSS